MIINYTADPIFKLNATAALSDVITNIYFEGGQNYKDENINLDEVECSGVEQNLLGCSHYPVGVSDCTHEEDAGVICERSEGTMDSLFKITYL